MQLALSLFNVKKFIRSLRALILQTLATALLLTLVSCAGKTQQRATVSVDTFLTLERGIALNQVFKSLNGAGKHQFTVLLNRTNYLCLYYLFEEPPVGFYLVFTNEHLKAIVNPPKSEFERVPYKDTYREIPKPKESTNMVEEVLMAKDLTREEITQLIRRALPRGESLNALPAFLIAAPLFAANLGEIKSDYEKNAELAKQYNPLKIKIGDSQTNVQESFGPPYKVIELEHGNEIQVFGGPINLRINPAYKFSSVAVVFEEGKVTQVLSDIFFDKRLL